MNETPETTRMKEALLHFENVMGVPAEHKDLPRWIKQVKAEFERLQKIVQIRRRRIHAKLFGEIAVLAPSRQDQIKQFKRIDRDIERLLDIVKTQILVLCLPKSEVEEDSVNPQVLDLIDRGTELVHWIKSQEETVAEWFAEAFVAES